jgi:hypothetical protein
MGYEVEEDDKEGFVNTEAWENECKGNEGWRIPNDTWLD